jgi:cysteine desulfurase
VPPQTLYWTSGGSESNSIPIFAQLLRNVACRSLTCLTSPLEHPSCLNNFEILERFGIKTHFVQPDSSGHIQPEIVEKTLKTAANIRFVSIQTVHNETGAVQDIAGIVRIVRREAPAAFIHSDSVQALGKIPLNLVESGVDSASFSAHKLGGPRGIGLLYLSKPLEVLVRGGGQEHGLRPGTENTAGAREFARCIELFAGGAALAAQSAAAQERASRLMAGLSLIERCALVPAGRAENGFSPYIIAVSFRDIPGEVMARLLDDAGFAVSTGSACSTGTRKKQSLSSMGIDGKTAFETIRISQGFSTTDDDIDRLLESLHSICAKY